MSGRGLGTIFRTAAGTTPGGSLSGADNGLSVAAGVVQLGGPLIQDTFITQFGNRLIVETGTGAGNMLELDPGNEFAYMAGSGAFISQLLLDGNTGMVFLGLLQDFLQIDPNEISMYTGGARSLFFDALNLTYSMGSVGGQGNQVAFTLDDGNEEAYISRAGGYYLYLDMSAAGSQYAFGDIDNITNGTMLNIQDSQQLVSFMSGGNEYFKLNVDTGLYQMGDIDNAANSSRLTIDDGNLVSTIQMSTVEYLRLDALNGFFWIGNSNPGGAYFSIDNTQSTFNFNSNGSSCLTFNDNMRQYSMGDLSPNGNGTRLDIVDVANEIQIYNTNNDVSIWINNIQGVTTTVANPTSITVTGGIVTAVS